MTEDWEASVPTASRAPQHVRLFPADDAYKHLCILTLLPSLGPLHLMLADALSPRGSTATLASVGTLSEGFERFVTSPLYLVGYVRWDARSNQSSFVKRSLQQLSGRNPSCRIASRKSLRQESASAQPSRWSTRNPNTARRKVLKTAQTAGQSSAARGRESR